MTLGETLRMLRQKKLSQETITPTTEVVKNEESVSNSQMSHEQSETKGKKLVVKRLVEEKLRGNFVATLLGKRQSGQEPPLSPLSTSLKSPKKNSVFGASGDPHSSDSPQPHFAYRFRRSAEGSDENDGVKIKPNFLAKRRHMQKLNLQKRASSEFLSATHRSSKQSNHANVNFGTRNRSVSKPAEEETPAKAL